MSISKMMPPRTILHLDLDAFYASVEALDNPGLLGKPVIVAWATQRSVVCAASYEARKFGVHSAMPAMRAKRLCPDGIFIAPRFDRYSACSAQVMEIFHRFTPLVEPLSLDEAFLDVTQSAALFGSGREIAAAIKRAVSTEVGLTVSAGVAEVKMAAKIATDLGKPDGLVEVPVGGTRAFLAPLPVGKLWGVGRVTEGTLWKLGLRTIGDVAAYPEALLIDALSEQGRHLKSLAQGDDPREVIPDERAKSVGAEETFDRDIQGREAVRQHLLSQSIRVGSRLRESQLAGRVITVKLKYSDFSIVTRRHTLANATDDSTAIFETALTQLERADLDRPIRLTGISVSGFDKAEQLDLFGQSENVDPRRRALNTAVDGIREKYGHDAVLPASLLPTNPATPKTKATRD